MGQVVSEAVSKFGGLLLGTRAGSIVSRHPLDRPKELENLIVDEFGKLWLPPAADEVYSTTPATERIKKFAHTRGVGVLTFADDKCYEDETQTPQDIVDGPATLTTAFTFANAQATNRDARRPPWIVSFGAEAGTVQGYVGNQLETWKLDGGTWSSISLTPAPHALVATIYKGRLFLGDGGGRRKVWFSDLNDPETFGADSWFHLQGNIGGGNTYDQYTGHITGLVVWEDMLVILASQSIWVLTGTTPETFTLRKTSSHVGCLAPESIVSVEGGLMFFGGTPDGEMGVYIWSGNQSRLVSADISYLFREWDIDSYEAVPADPNQEFRNKEEDEAEWYFNAMRWNDHYVFSAPTITSDDRNIFAYNLKTQAWTTFTGWGTYPRLGIEKKYYHPYVMIIDDDGTMYRATKGIPRSSGEVGKAVFGWHDQGDPTGLLRFMGVKLSGFKSGSGTPTVSIDVTTDSGDTVSVGPIDLTTDVFDGVLLPVNLRGHAAEIELTITPQNSDDEVLIEQMELLSSRKGAKVSRV